MRSVLNNETPAEADSPEEVLDKIDGRMPVGQSR
jgi:hypothetical protein